MKNSQNPNFVTALTFKYLFEELQQIRFDVYVGLFRMAAIA